MKKASLVKVICLVVFGLLVISQMGYTWPVNNGVAICTETHEQFYPQIVSDGKGGSIIVWQDWRNDTDLLNPDIYIQSISSTGTVRWTANGVVICNATLAQTKPQIISDGQGGAIITWADWRNDPDSGTSDIYAQAISSTGVVKWTANGVSVCTAFDYQTNPQIVSDGQGGAVITWEDKRTSNESYTYAQAINSNGTMKWTAGGVAICTASPEQVDPQIVTDGKGGAIIAWRDYRNDNNDIFAQAVSSTGAIKWNLSGIAISAAAAHQGRQKIVSDGQGGAIVTWEDNRDGPITYDIYAQAISNTGNVKWTLDGVGICKAIGIQWAPEIASNGQGGAIITWEDWRSGNGHIYAQAINNAGTVNWTANGISISTAERDRKYQKIISDGQGGAVITWQDYRTDTDNDIYAQAVDSSGVAQWTRDGVAICTATGEQNEPQLVSNGRGGAIITWYDYRNINADIYAQGINSNNRNVMNVMAIPGDKQVTLSWTNPDRTDYSATKILRREDRYPTGPNDGTQVYWFNGSSCVDSGLTNGKTYYYGLFAHDTANVFASGVFISVYLNWQPTEGDFNTSLDTTSWGFQQPGGVTQIPSYSWLSSYNGRTGILKLSYSSQTEGLKLTSIARLFNGAGNNWYRLRVQYASDSPNNGHEIVSQMLSYPGHPSFTITEIGGNWTGNGQMVSNRWYTYDAYVYSSESSQQIQLMLKNNGSPGDFYIDSILCDSTVPPAIVSPISVPVTTGDFDSATDTAGWAFQNTPDGINGKGTQSWVSSVGAQNGVLALNFNNLYQGVKVTSIPTYTIATNRNAVMSFKFRSNLSNPTTLHILGYLYGERDLATFKVDLAGKGVLGNFVGNGWNTAYVPLTSVSGNTSFRLQLIIKNNAQTPETVYLDDIQLVYSSTVVATQLWAELIEEPASMGRKM